MGVDRNRSGHGPHFLVIAEYNVPSEVPVGHIAWVLGFVSLLEAGLFLKPPVDSFLYQLGNLIWDGLV